MDLGFNTSNVPSLTCSTYSIESQEGAIPGFDEINSNAALPAVSNGMSSLVFRLDVMENPHIAADGYTYEGDAIKGWLYSGHDTSPMTNLKLDTCDLIPNYALYRTIQEWQQQS
ncbi:U-box domain-containing protein 36 [Capsicum baccatum]|uniref:U-box domain-containing protein 36 n=1 Tax=Capsicum baccatum TaxID=33114 RepID=A0A2G2WHW9_CAPBA|nr:U-box domain-containing protein 36 [Capsicum baccatum]